MSGGSHCLRIQSKAPFLKGSASTELQEETETECDPYFVDMQTLPHRDVEHLREAGLLSTSDQSSLDICVLRDKHCQYLERVWSGYAPQLRPSFVSLDSSRTWMVYWTIHPCDLLGRLPDSSRRDSLVETLASCFTRSTVKLKRTVVEKDRLLSGMCKTIGDGASAIEFPAGGFGGGPGQIAHAATTYGAVMALAILAPSTPSALELLESVRLTMYPWMLSLQNQDGSVCMHEDGEIDVRATYCIVAAAKLLNLLQGGTLNSPETSEFLGACQTFEGGFGGEPFSEAHGGYAYCATAALRLLNRMDSIDLEALRGWLARRQMSYEGGFHGRTNKVVDGCYSFWQGGALAIVSAECGEATSIDDPWLDNTTPPKPLLFDQAMLERYILLCAQDVLGGLRDKPSKKRDFYHSCYNLSGLSVTQHAAGDGPCFGHSHESRVAPTHPLYNIRIDRARFVLEHFSKGGGLSDV